MGAYTEFEINSSGLSGKRNNVNFWLDKWAGQALTSLMNILPHLNGRLNLSLATFLRIKKLISRI